MGEKKSLILFLATYLISMIVFIAVFDYLYFKNIVNEISLTQKELIKQQLLSNDLRFRFWERKFNDLNVTVYRGNQLLKKSPQVGTCIEYDLVRGRGRFKVIACKIFENKKKKILLKLLVYNILFFVFISIIAYFLARLFLKPMKDDIKRLEEFIRDVTHEMQTPISVINSNIEMLQIRNVEFKELKRIENASKRLSSIFEMLKFLRIKKKSLKKINLKTLLQERIKFFETQMEKRKISIKLEATDVIREIDVEDLIRIFDNLISNAVKYSQGKEIFIYLNEKSFCVKNKGIVKNPKKVVQKYVRENQNEGGFGLGLYIVSEICKFYGFRFEIKNENGFVISCVYI